MDLRVLSIIVQKEQIKLSPDEINYTEYDLLIDCPELRFDARNKTKKYIWHDLQKLASHVGSKNNLIYDISDVMPLIESEMEFLLQVRIDLIKILRCVSAKRNKKLILSILESLYERSFSTGGGTSCMVRRILAIFEMLGGKRTATKRKSDQTDDQSEDSEEDGDSDYTDMYRGDQSPGKRRKNLTDPAAAMIGEEAPPALPRGGWMHKLDLSTERQMHAINQEELGLPVPEDVQQQLDRIEMETLLEFHIDLGEGIERLL